MDGTENPAELALRLETAVIKDGKNAGGAFAIHQTWIHDVKSFEALPEHEQEHVFGRTKLGSVQLEEGLIRSTSHVKRMVVHENGRKVNIVRQSMPFGTYVRNG